MKNEKKKRVFEKFSPRTEWGSKCFWQRNNSGIPSQIFVRDVFGSKSQIRGSVTLMHGCKKTRVIMLYYSRMNNSP